MSFEAVAAARHTAEVVPRGTGTWLAIGIATAALLVILEGPYRVVALALMWALYLVSHPSAGLWFAPVLVMAASFLAPPAGFEWGAGYSPELAYWAVASCIAFAATALGYLTKRAGRNSVRRIPLPRALYAFAAASVVSAIVGLQRGYSAPNVGKQFYGCLLFVAYFWLALRLAPTISNMRRVTRVILEACALFSGLYVGTYLWRIGAEGFHKELTILSTYSASVAVLLLPQLSRRSPASRWKIFAIAALLLSVPFLAEYKRGLAGFLICAFMAFGLRSRFKARRYAALAAGLALFTLFLATPILDYVGRAVSNVPVLAGLVPADVQTNYSVYLRLTQTAQMMASTNSPSLLGTGLGSSLTWYDPYTHTLWTQETVDIGWVYLLIKLGVLGLAAFLWLIASLCLRSLRAPPEGMHMGFLLLVVFFIVEMVADTGFVYFMTASWAGMACGWIHVLNQRGHPPCQRYGSGAAQGRAAVPGPSVLRPTERGQRG
jgi:hypothetical protein